MYQITSTIDAAVQQALANPIGGMVYGAGGTYPAGLTYSVPAGKSLKFKGDSAGLTVFNGSLAVDFLSTGQFAAGAIGAEDLSFGTANAGTGTGFSLISTTEPGAGPVKDIRNVSFAGISPGAYWNIGLLLDGVAVATLDNLRFYGLQSGVNFYGTGLQVQNSQTIHATDYTLDKCKFWEIGTAINILEGIEGFFATDLEVVGANIGLQWIQGAGTQVPLLNLVGGHINSAQFGIVTNGVAQIFVSNYDIYRYTNNGKGQNWCGIDIENATTAGTSEKIDLSEVDILGFPTNDGTACNGIALNNTTGATIELPGIDSCQTGIWLKPGTKNCTINGASKITNCGTAVLNQGTGNVINP